MEIRSKEIEILKLLYKIEEGRPSELSSTGAVKEEAVMRIAFSLEEKDLAEVEKNIETIYSLGEEGKILLKKGFPEDRIIELVSEDVKSIRELSKNLPKDILEIGLGWIKRKDLGYIENGKIKLTDKGDEWLQRDRIDYRILELLEDTDMGKEEILERVGCDAEILDELKQRDQAIKEEEETSYRIEITERGKEVIEEGIEEENKIRDLTSEDIRSERWKKKSFMEYDVTKPVSEKFPGKKHPYQHLMDEMRRVFRDMGFKEIKGDTIESGFWNFDALFQPQDHPAREMQDTLYLNKPEVLELPEEELVERVKKMHKEGGNINSEGWGGEWNKELAKMAVLRTHTTATTIRYLWKNPNPPVKVFSIDRAYRRETVDATHLPQFYQLDGVVMDKDLSFKNLLGFLAEFYSRMGFEDIRFRPGYFPYTEPSVEPEVYIEDLNEWIELGGAGVFRKEVTEPLGIDYPVLAWGLGIGRLAMIKLGLNDLRKLYESDIDWLRRSPSCL